MKNPNDIIGNRTHDLLACSGVSQSTSSLRNPTYIYIYIYISGSPDSSFTSQNMSINLSLIDPRQMLQLTVIERILLLQNMTRPLSQKLDLDVGGLLYSVS